MVAKATESWQRMVRAVLLCARGRGTEGGEGPERHACLAACLTALSRHGHGVMAEDGEGGRVVVVHARDRGLPIIYLYLFTYIKCHAKA